MIYFMEIVFMLQILAASLQQKGYSDAFIVLHFITYLLTYSQ